MKHIIVVGIIVVLMLVLMGSSVLANGTFDINGDGITDVQDCSEVWQSIKNGEQNMDYDVDGNFQVDVQDCALIFANLDSGNGNDTIWDIISEILWN